jgi:glycosyltransferase involved in cell wall biosynthesis
MLAQKAGRIIAISQNTKKDILHFFDIEEDIIDVVYLGNSSAVKCDFSSVGLKLPERFILFVGTRQGYKNFNFFIKAITPILRKDEDLYIVCAGGEKFSKDEIRFLDKLGIKNRIFRYFVEDDVLSYFYQKARVFVFPSLYEGFGIPVLESLSNNCPVALSNTSSLPEAAGEAGLYFNPQDELSLMDAVSKIVYNDAVRKDLQLKGVEQIKKFSWEKASDETAKVYRKLL